jgi:LPXTG-motif cell wall-anchored protein
VKERELEQAPSVTRRAFVRGGGVALGAAVAWTVPDIRTMALAEGSGTPAPAPPAAEGAEAAAAAGARGRLPATGTDPTPLLLAGGGAVVAGAALVSIAKDPDPARD